MSECINSPQRILLKDLIAKKLVENRLLVGGNSRYLLPDMTEEERKKYRAESRRLYYLRNKERLDEYQKNYRATHKERKHETDLKYQAKKRREKENAAK